MRGGRAGNSSALLYKAVKTQDHVKNLATMAIRTVQIKGVLKTLIKHQISTLDSNKCHFFESNRLSKSKKSSPSKSYVSLRSENAK